MDHDLSDLIDRAAATPSRPVDVQTVWRRGRRRRATKIGVGTASVTVVTLAVLGSLLSLHRPNSKEVPAQVAQCNTADLGHVHASWSLHGLVLDGRLLATNTSRHSCVLSPPQITLLTPRGMVIKSQSDGAVPVDRLAPQAAITVEPGVTAQAKVGWGGSYCGPPLGVVYLRLEVDHSDLTIPVSGPALTCLADNTYYSHGQSSAAISGFRVPRDLGDQAVL